jgi:hypothetical protein
LDPLGCTWFAFLGQSRSRGAGEWRLVACTTPEPGSLDAISLLLHASQKRQKRPFLQCQARLMQLFLSSLAISTRVLRFEASRRRRPGRSDRPLGG